MSPEQVIVLAASLLGIGGIASWAIATGQVPRLPGGPVIERAGPIVRVVAHYAGDSWDLVGAQPDPYSAVNAAMLELARYRRRHPGKRRDVRVVLADDAVWNEWAVRRWGAAPSFLAFTTHTRQLVGSGMPLIVVRTMRDGVAVPWSEVVSLICHETIHVSEYDYAHADAGLWSASSGATSVEVRAHIRAMSGA